MRARVIHYRAIATLLIFGILLSACAPARWENPEPAARQTSNQTERSSRGNPPFYEVFGNRYYVLASSAGHSERGLASWYGKKFHGNPTSSGEIYDMHAMTAAHKTLPLPTMVSVTNLSNGKKIIVRVNDRGPFIGDRIIDLSFAAATKLDMINAGIAMVEVVALTNPGNHAAVSKPDGTPETISDQVSGILFLQVGAFSDDLNAQRLRQQLETNGITRVVIHDDQSGSTPVYRVRIGPLADIAEYDSLVRRVATLSIHDPHLVVEPESGSNNLSVITGS